MTKLISVDRCRSGQGTFVVYGDRELAVFLLESPERVFVMDNACPHASGNLSGGEIRDGKVDCPWHHWEFELSTGVCTHSDRARVTCYQAHIRDGYVWAALS